MGRGGARAGAGRRPALEWDERFWVGATCEGLWNDAVAAAKNASIANFRDQSDLAAIYAKLAEKILPDGRKVFLESDDFEAHAYDVEEERRTLARMADDDESPVPRLFHVHVPRPMGKRQPIIAEVAARASERYAKPVSRRIVRECWEETRAALNSG